MEAAVAEVADDDIPRLPQDTLAVLQQFYDEQTKVEENSVSENWQLSQFWYDDETATLLAREVLRLLPKNNSDEAVAFISCPTAYEKLREIGFGDRTVKLLEYDKRFGIRYPEHFVHYDYKQPTELPFEYVARFGVIVVDPPFLADECIEKTSETVRWLSKSVSSSKLIVCTGAVMKKKCKELLNVDQIKFQPKHANNLANEFRCYTNFRPQILPH